MKQNLNMNSWLINNFAFSNNKNSFSKNDQTPASVHYNDKFSTSNSYEKVQMSNEYFYSVFTRNSSPIYEASYKFNTQPTYMLCIYIWLLLIFSVLKFSSPLTPAAVRPWELLESEKLKYCVMSLCDHITFLYTQYLNVFSTRMENTLHHSHI